MRMSSGLLGTWISRSWGEPPTPGLFDLTTDFLYNPEGQAMTLDPPGFGVTDQTSFTFDPTTGNQLPATRTDSLIGTTSFQYDAFNRRIVVTDPNGVATETRYDELDRVRLVIQRSGAFTPGDPPAPGDLVTENRYGEFGDLEVTILPEGNVIAYAYDTAGRLTSIEP